MARVYQSSVINGSAEKVWERVRDFNGLPKWHPRIRDSRIEEALPSDKIGCIRNFNLQNGDNIREQLLGLSDYDMFCTYAILESPMPLTDYVATLRLTPVTEGERCFIEWSAEFSCDPAQEGDLVNGIGTNVFLAGFDALKRHFGS
ncbi:MAG: SRPBCC family protein [Hyphomicrobiaceae bacterium]